MHDIVFHFNLKLLFGLHDPLRACRILEMFLHYNAYYITKFLLLSFQVGGVITYSFDVMFSLPS